MSVAVLMYHHVLPEAGFIASSVKQFEAQMGFLAKNGYKTLSSNEFYLYKKGLFTPPKKSVLITFDDGWRDNLIYAYPVLKRYGLRATLFLVTGWIEAASEQMARDKVKFSALSHQEAKLAAPQNPAALFLNWDDVAKMSDVFDFHSHTHGHSDSYFGELCFADELGLCRETMKKRLGFDDIQLCWPRGKFDEGKLMTAKEAGYELFYTTKRGINRPDNVLDDVRRIAVKRDELWLRKSLMIYSNDILGGLYSWLKP